MSSVEGLCETNIEKTEINFKVVTRNSNGLLCYYEDDQIIVDILTPAGDQLKTEVIDTKDGRYTVTYKPESVGQHRVQIQVNVEPLTGSPWVVQVRGHQYQYEFHFGSTGKGQGELNKPWDIAVSGKTGTITVADSELKGIQMFSSDGTFLRTIKLRNEPFQKDILAHIPDEAVCKLSLFTETGQFIKYISDKHTKTQVHLSVPSDGHIIICDGKGLLRSFSALGCDLSPRCAVYHQDTFFVSYPYANCVKVFNNAGVYQYHIGCEGSGDGQLSYPTGLVIDKCNDIIVCDAGNKRLQLFALNGTFLRKIQNRCFDYSYLCYSAVSNEGNLFVTDFEKKCVHVFQ